MSPAVHESSRSPIPETERRRTKRLHLQLPAAVFLQGSPRYVPFVLRDLSMGGAYLSSEVSIVPGERFVLSIRPPGTSSPIVAQARVVRVQREGSGQADGQGAGMGVVFTAMSHESYAVLSGFWHAARWTAKARLADV